MKLTHSHFYHPEKKVDNIETIKYFEEKGISMQKIQNALGRENKYYIDENSDENSLTLGIKAGEKVLEDSKTSISEIDIIIFVSNTHEYSITFDAIKIHNALRGKSETICYDLNANCIGGFVALDNVSKYMTVNKKIKKALIICAEHFSKITDKENPLIAFSFTDSALAMIIENDDSTSGLIDIMYHTDSSYHDTTRYPPNGYSKHKNDDVLHWERRFDGRGSVDFALENIEKILERNNLLVNEIDLFLFSQFSLKNVEIIINHFNLDPNKVPFYAKELGYTGSSSPFLVLNQYQKRVRKTKKGEKILIWTLGAGYQAGLMLWEY